VTLIGFDDMGNQMKTPFEARQTERMLMPGHFSPLNK
jgi:hypothetical protein